MYQETAFDDDGREPLCSLSSSFSDDSLSGLGIGRTPFFRNQWALVKNLKTQFFFERPASSHLKKLNLKIRERSSFF